MTNAPVFIGGCPRGGTTAIWNALVQHPSLRPVSDRWRDKELWFMAEFFEGRDPQDAARRSHPLDEEFEREAACFIDKFLQQRQASMTGRYVTAFVDNSLHTEKILRCLPEARMILVIRHPQDNVWSLLNAAFAPGWLRSAKSADLITEQEIIRATGLWKRRAHVVLRALSGEFGERVLVVRQERMVTHPEDVAREVLHFIGEPFEPAVAETLAAGVINTSFPPGREASAKSFMETVPLAGAAERLAFFQRNRERLTEDPRICAVVRSLVSQEMQSLGYEDLAATSRAAGASGGTSHSRRMGELREAQLVQTFPPNTGHPEEFARRSYAVGEDATLKITVRANQEIRHPSVSFLVRDGDGTGLFGTTTFDERVEIPDMAAGEEITVCFRFPIKVRPGSYTVAASFNSVSSRDYYDNVLFHQIDNMLSFEVTPIPDRPIHYKLHIPVGIAHRRNGRRDPCRSTV